MRDGTMTISCRALRSQSGQALILLLGVAAAVMLGALVLTAFGQALGGKSRHQRAADLAAVSAAGSMRRDYPRLFERAYLEDGVPNPRHLSSAAYIARARAAGVRVARRNGVRVLPSDLSFPDGSFAATRVTVRVMGRTEVRIRRRRGVPVRARATAELVPPAGDGLLQPGFGSGGGYDGPLAYRMGKPMRPDVASAFDRMAASAGQAGLALSVTSGFRSDAEQARLFAANPDPRWVAPPGKSLHRYATELDLGPPAAYGWLSRNARRFGFIQRYSWEAWHYGYIHNAGSGSVGFGRRTTPDGRRSSLPAFVPASLAPLLTRAAQRWNISAALLAAQLYAESNFNPFAVSPAGARGIAQFMPATALAYGLRDAFDPAQSIDAQGRMMRDLMRRFASVPLALAAYNAGPAAVARCMCIPPYPETRAYVARILGLLGGAGDLPPAGLEVKLIE
ncbi:MAG: transglycosylase SLT domain-containing protein [Actinomycetota bacterium]|nr:transglycosylase SLT domain-containing protein [Actinomycetota bacterium]